MNIKREKIEINSVVKAPKEKIEVDPDFVPGQLPFILVKRWDITRDGAGPDTAELRVLKYTSGAYVGKIITEGVDGSEREGAEPSVLDELKLYEAWCRFRTLVKDADKRPEQRPQPQNHKQQRPQPPQRRVDLPTTLLARQERQERPKAQQKPQPVPERLAEAPAAEPDEEEELFIMAMTSAGVTPPSKTLGSMERGEILSHLSREVGGPLTLRSKEIEDPFGLSPQELSDALVESLLKNRNRA